MIRAFLTFLVLLSFLGLGAQYNNRPVPPELFTYQFTSYSPVNGYFFTTPFKIGIPPANPNFKSPCPTILDSAGYVVWYLQNGAANNSDLKYHQDHSKFSFYRSMGGATTYFVLDINLNIIDSISNTADTESDAHEFQILPNGNYILGAIRDSVMDLSAFTFNGNQGGINTVVEAYVVQEFDSGHNLVFQWNSLDHIHPTETYDAYGYNVNGFDYCHANSIEQDTDGNLLISFRHLDAVYKIDHVTGNVIWILGGESSSFSYTNDVGHGGQHDARRLANGNISMFDNTNNHAPPHRSRGVEYSLDTINWTATRTWEYIYTPSFFSMAMGSHQKTPDLYHLVNYGLNYRPNPSFALVDDLGTLLAKSLWQDSVMNYRSHFYDLDFNFQRPTISCNNDGIQLELSAPGGFAAYKWNTGETTQSIFVNSAGTYQVWMNYGDGMMGSFPITITNPATECFSSIGEENEFEKLFITHYYDLLGREILQPSGGNLYIVLYNDLSKKMIYVPK